MKQNKFAVLYKLNLTKKSKKNIIKIIKFTTKYLLIKDIFYFVYIAQQIYFAPK